eukprot:COSAG02_NODE_6191_length_3741_cov_8.726249_4_plen_81_part_00
MFHRQAKRHRWRQRCRHPFSDDCDHIRVGLRMVNLCLTNFTRTAVHSINTPTYDTYSRQVTQARTSLTTSLETERQQWTA